MPKDKIDEPLKLGPRKIENGFHCYKLNVEAQLKITKRGLKHGLPDWIIVY